MFDWEQASPSFCSIPNGMIPGEKRFSAAPLHYGIGQGEACCATSRSVPCPSTSPPAVPPFHRDEPPPRGGAHRTAFRTPTPLPSVYATLLDLAERGSNGSPSEDADRVRVSLLAGPSHLRPHSHGVYAFPSAWAAPLLRPLPRLAGHAHPGPAGRALEAYRMAASSRRVLFSRGSVRVAAESYGAAVGDRSAAPSSRRESSASWLGSPSEFSGGKHDSASKSAATACARGGGARRCLPGWRLLTVRRTQTSERRLVLCFWRWHGWALGRAPYGISVRPSDAARSPFLRQGAAGGSGSDVHSPEPEISARCTSFRARELRAAAVARRPASARIRSQT